MLSDHHTAKERGLGQGDQTDADHEDIGAIGRILQRALLKNREKQLLGVFAAVVGSSAPHAVDFDGAAERI